MKPYCIILALTLLIVLQRCSHQQHLAIVYPPNITADSQQVFTQHFKKGHALYEVNCAGCHTQQVSGRKVIPDFSLPQLLDYEMRFQYAAHENRLREVDISVQELDDIQVFLQYKEPSGVPAFPDRVPKLQGMGK